MTFERRIGEKWQLKPTDLAVLPWDELKASINEQIQGSIKRREERLFGENEEIKRDLDANQELLQEALEDDDALLKLLQLTTQGKHVAFDERSHRKQLRTHNRLTYLFSMANELNGQAPETVKEDILTHLQGAEERLAEIFGASDWNRLKLNEMTVGSLPEASQKAITQEVGQQVWEDVATQPMADVDEELVDRITPVIGFQSQNRIYRDLLLRTITEAWVEYLTRMEALRVSISMESYAQKDPLVQYKRQASTMFSELLSEVRQGVISYMYRYRPVKPAEAETEQNATQSISSGKSKKKRRRRH
jgi:preprotein translocase subunit SecA